MGWHGVAWAWVGAGVTGAWLIGWHGGGCVGDWCVGAGVTGDWCLVFGVWCLVLGVWCLVTGDWCLVFGPCRCWLAQYGLETHLLSNALLSALGVDGAGIDATDGSALAVKAQQDAVEWEPVLEVRVWVWGCVGVWVSRCVGVGV